MFVNTPADDSEMIKNGANYFTIKMMIIKSRHRERERFSLLLLFSRIEEEEEKEEWNHEWMDKWQRLSELADLSTPKPHNSLIHCSG
jgi:hypothetical protein